MFNTCEQSYIDACLEGNIDKIERMISCENKQFKNKRFLLKCLYSACEGGHNNIFMTLLGYRNVIGERSQYEFGSILRYAGKGGNTDIINYIVRLYKKKYTNIHSMWNNCIIGACESGNLTIFKLYTSRVRNISNCINECLHNAYKSDNVILVNYILGKYSIYSHAYMTSACLSGNLELVNRYINCIDYLLIDTWVEPLAAALLKGNVEVAKCIIERISNPLLINDIHVLHNRFMKNACYSNNLLAIELIMKWGTEHLGLTKLNTLNSLSLNNGLCGACYGGHIEIVKFMISKGATDYAAGLFAACTGDGDEDYACKNVMKYVEIIKLMVTYGASNFEMILKYACLCGNIELAQLAIENGAVDFERGLVTACKNGSAEIVRLIIKHGTRIGVIPKVCLNDGLCKVVYGNENTDIINLLIIQGANNLESLKNTKDFKLYCRYCNYKNIQVDKKKYIKLLCEYPPYILLVGSRIKQHNCCIKKLPVELLRLLFQYI